MIRGIIKKQRFQGRLNRIPADFTLSTRDTSCVAWQLWHFGDKTKGYPPYRLLTASDMPATKSIKPRFCEFRKLMVMFEDYLKETGFWMAPATEEDTARLFGVLADGLDLYSTQGYKRNTRPEQRSWRTTLKTLESWKKSKRS